MRRTLKNIQHRGILMNAKDIITRRFEKATFNGYKTDDVDEFLREISNEYAQLQKEKSELERKLEVLADKIREYRDDEDALKDALLLAQKQGNAIVAESKAAADKLKKETDEAVAKQLADAKAKSEKLISEAEDYKKRMVTDSNGRADKLVKDARAQAEEIKRVMNEQQEKQEVILQRTRKEVAEYNARILAMYKQHVDFLQSIPEKVEDDFVKRTAEAVEKREAERAAQAKRQAAAKQAEKKPAQPEADEHEPFKAVSEDAAKPEKPAEDKAKPAAPAAPPVTERTFESDLPFFNSASEPKNRHTDLQFGKNSK